MARILVAEKDPAVRRLLEVRLDHLGHQPVAWDGETATVAGIDAAVVEPADAETLWFARVLRRDQPHVPIVVSSSRGRTLETASLRPAAHLVKPFALSRFERALDDALAPDFSLAIGA